MATRSHPGYSLTTFFSRTKLSEIIPNIARRFTNLEALFDDNGTAIATLRRLNTKEPPANPPITLSE
jgi:hypothetical protein